jgi:hypothetical protein
LILHGMQGLGDNLYQRAVLKQYPSTVFLQTAWPQIYADMTNVVPVRPTTRLRTQAKNAARHGVRYKREPIGRHVAWHYSQSPTLSMLQSLSQGLGMAPEAFDMAGPVYPVPEVVARPYVVVRPVCLRNEWTSDSRNPLPEYVAEAVDELRQHFAIVSVADLAERHEWALPPLPRADVVLHKGELPIEQLLGLVRGASALVGGVGWIVPAALAYRVPLMLIFGGWGFSNGPHRIFGPGVDHGFVDEVYPDAFCRCNENRHACDKRISGFGDRARAFAARIVRRAELAAGSGNRLVSSEGATV